MYMNQYVERRFDVVCFVVLSSKFYVGLSAMWFWVN